MKTRVVAGLALGLIVGLAGCGWLAADEVVERAFGPDDVPSVHRTEATPCPPSSPLDHCLSDSDCGPSGVCLCAPPTSILPPGGPYRNLCTPATCRTDADCEGDFPYCSPSLSVDYGPPTYHCHAAHDECLDNADCANVGPCHFNDERFVCEQWGDFGTIEEERECYADRDCLATFEAGYLPDLSHPESLYCESGTCRECRSDDDCGAGAICGRGKCYPLTPCADATECPDALQGCVEGFCQACVVDEDCRSEQICFSYPGLTCRGSYSPPAIRPVCLDRDLVDPRCQTGECPTFCEHNGYSVFCFKTGMFDEPGEHQTEFICNP